ncbi:hypothetical protein BT93_F2880 [Corymbia citriodora subsp. variegata]|nr:hypothetical protein BT93_F2880 [Corymbia citriodora subsp. variegata]
MGKSILEGNSHCTFTSCKHILAFTQKDMYSKWDLHSNVLVHMISLCFMNAPATIDRVFMIQHISIPS